MENHNISKLVYFHSTNSLLDKSMDIVEEVQRHIGEIFIDIEEYVQHGSGWLMENIYGINIMITNIR